MLVATGDGIVSEPFTSTSTSTVEWSEPCRRFEFDEILSATENFKESLVIGCGGFGNVYKGNLVKGSTHVGAVIKRLDLSSEYQGLWSEVETLSKLHHTHIVSLIGYCNTGKEMILVYEYIPNGTLDEHLHTVRTLLSWLQRLKICIGAARGLHHLHTGTGTEFGIIHGNVKTSNILLNKSWVAKITDFGLSEMRQGDVKTGVRGTFGYMDPHYFYTGILSRKSDVYGFGVILLEVLCRRRVVDESLDEEQMSLTRWAQDSIKEGRMKHIIDSDIRDEISPNCLKGFVQIAERCLDEGPEHRPAMAEVVSILESLLNLQERTNNLLLAADSIESEHSIYTSTSAVEWSEPCRHFEFHEVLSATENFDESLVIGRGGFGRVYKGNLVNGSSSVVAAIKRYDPESNQGVSEFRAEVKTLSKLRHAHLVSLIGYCDDGKEMILVYNYIPNGTLYEHLHHARTLLSWLQRLKICIDVARGLNYLHTGTGTEFGIIHRDVKSSNILLNQNLAAKITDFGLSQIVPRDEQSAYVDRYYNFATRELSRESDVYAFGVVLLEVLYRKRATDRSLDEEGWVFPSCDSIKEGHLKHVIDSDIRDEISPECLNRFVQIVERCLDKHPKHRPTMAEVVSTLESVLNLQEKTNNLLQAAWKTRFGRKVDKFSITATNKHSGMEFGFRIPKKRKLLMLREKILQQNEAKSFINFPIKILQLKINCFGSIKFFGAKALKNATNNYAQDRILGRGAQGIVYKGILPDKCVVAIKKHRILSQSRLEQFITEIVILEKINHANVVRLLGCCFQTEEAMLVYELVSNGNLHQLIHSRTSNKGILSWDSRLRIAHESANALDYLHTHATVSIIHRDVKSANILLDENYTAKISDFGSSTLIHLHHGQVNAHFEGTFGYLDPEYIDTRQLTRKTDVYGFGVILTELLTGKKPIDREIMEDGINLSTYFVRETKENRLREIVDPHVLEAATDEQLSAACDLVHRCLEPLGGNRPSMKEVTMELQRIRKLGKTSPG